MQYEIKHYLRTHEYGTAQYAMVGITDSENKFTGVVINRMNKNPYEQEYFLDGNLVIADEEDSDDVREDLIEEKYPGLLTAVFDRIYEFFEFDADYCVYEMKPGVMSRFLSISHGTDSKYYVSASHPLLGGDVLEPIEIPYSS